MTILAPGDPITVDGQPARFVEYSTDTDEPYLVYTDAAGIERWVFAGSGRLRVLPCVPSATLAPSNHVLTNTIDRDKVTT